MSKLFYLQPSSMVKSKVNTHIFLYSSLFLPLPFVAIIIVVVSVMFFWRPKERKAPAHGTYQSVVALFESCLWATFLSHFQPCHESLFVCFLGAAELSRLAVLVHLTSVHTVLALFPKNKRPFVVLLTVPDLFINYLCYSFC